MTDLHVTADLSYMVESPTAFAFSVVVARTPFQRVASETIRIEPELPWTLTPYGGEGTHQLLRCVVEAGDLHLGYEATTTVDAASGRAEELAEVSFEELPADVLPYLNPSRYCESDKLGGFAWRLFGDIVPGHGRVKAISDWVTDNLEYIPGSTDVTSSTTDVLLQRAGVCRDYAHVAISLCRALGVPARYVSGYGAGVEPQDFHGFFEAFIGTQWVLFDPTGMAPPNGLVRIGYGRDAADAPFATLVGRATLTEKTVRVHLANPLEPAPEAASTA